VTANVVDGKVKLDWAAGTGDESEFLVERNCGSGYSQIALVPSLSLTFSDSTVPASTSCSYQVKGRKLTPCAWTSAPSTATQLLAPPIGPVLNATAENAFQILLEWNDAADEEGYDIEAQVFNGAWMPVISLSANIVHYTDSHGINPGTRYTYRVRARRSNGSSAWGQDSVSTPAYTPGTATCTVP
jgi:hypothetical protein